METTKDNMTRADRMVLANRFAGVADRIGASKRGYSPEDKEAVAFAAELIARVASGWGNSGTPRKAGVGSNALYHRWRRARIALVNARTPEEIAEREAEVGVAEAEYRAKLAEEGKAHAS